jgi:NADH-quinone oxidoreductase E subunit
MTTAAAQNIRADIEAILARHPGAKRDALIPILQEVQESVGYLSRESIIRIGRHLDLPASKIFGVATFYNQFRFQAQGKYVIQICRGTACHVKGSLGLLDILRHELGIEPGETTKDGLFTLEVVACIGACGLAPVISVNGEFYADMTSRKVRDLVEEYRERAEDNDNQ